MGGAASGPIPWTAIERMAQAKHYDLEHFTLCIREMDALVLEDANRDPKAPKVNRSRTFGPDVLRQKG